MSFQKILNELLESQTGALVKNARYQAEQVSYMQNVAQLLHAKPSELAVSLIEAETGIGKGLGYLLPSVLWLNQNPNDVIVIGTHTRALQKQLIDNDVELVKKVFKSHGLIMPKIAIRMGKQAFFSVSRTINAVESLPKDWVKQEHHNLISFCKESCKTGSGLWLDYLDEYSGFPQGIKADDICLVEQGVIDNHAYEKHLEKANNANLIITNHATILNKHALSAFENKVHLLIIDESHEMYNVCKDMATHRLQIRSINNMILSSGIKGKFAKEVINSVDALSKELTEIDAKYKADILSDATHIQVLSKVKEQLIPIHHNLGGVLTKYQASVDKSEVTNEQAVLIRDMQDALLTLEKFIDNNIAFSRRALMYSPKMRIASVGSVSNHAGNIFAYRSKKLTKRILLTSATISDASNRDLFNDIKYKLKIKDEQVLFTRKYSPMKFGDMQFIRTSKSVPNPVMDYSEETTLNDTWLQNTANMVVDAVKKGSTMVLTQSFAEADAIYEKIKSKAPKLKIGLHKQNTSLQEVINPFVAGEIEIIITPSAWDGISLRDKNGGQLIKSLVISRIPFKPNSALERQMYIEYAMEQGKTEGQAIRNLWLQAQQEAVIKLKQGLGRGVRSPTDEIVVYLCDPRMPQPSHVKGLINAIPQRFRENYYNSTVFGEVNKLKPIYL